VEGEGGRKLFPTQNKDSVHKGLSGTRKTGKASKNGEVVSFYQSFQPKTKISHPAGGQGESSGKNSASRSKVLVNLVDDVVKMEGIGDFRWHTSTTVWSPRDSL